MRILIPLLALLPCQIAAADTFRVVDIGAPCESIADKEAAAGSQQVRRSDGDVRVLEFRTELMGEDAALVYLCRDGVLFTENYFFPERDTETSLHDFRKVYDALTARYGPAILDNTPWSPDLDPRWIEKDPKKYYVTWRNADARITISLMSRQENVRYVFMVVAAGAK
jgi:hypothetical protein